MQQRNGVVLIGLLFGAAVCMRQPLRRVVFAVFRFPLVVVQSGIGIVRELPRLPELALENATLRHELASRQLELATLREGLRSAQHAQELSRAIPDASVVIASVIGLPIIPTQHVVMLNKGTRHGVVTDTVLLAPGGLVGRVIDAYETTSVAMLVTDPNSRVACLLERSRESGLLIGTGERTCQLIYLDVAADIAVEDRVVTAGLGGPFPKGIVVGTVTKVQRDERNARAIAWVRPSVKLSQVEDVACLPPSQ